MIFLECDSDVETNTDIIGPINEKNSSKNTSLRKRKSEKGLIKENGTKIQKVGSQTKNNIPKKIEAKKQIDFVNGCEFELYQGQANTNWEDVFIL